MKVLVTGGAGYVGSHTCKALYQNGFTPVVVDNLSNGHRWAVKWGPFYQADILDTNKLIEIIRLEKIEAVLHFAAFAYVGESVKDPLKYYNNNLIGTLSVLNAMRESKVNKIVFSSSCVTFGSPETMPIDENTPQVPISPYGHTKYMCEKAIKDYAVAYGFSGIALRYFNASGADGEIGEDHRPETHLIPLAISASLVASSQLTIFGKDYPTPDGTCIRDYVHVSDLAAAHVLALQQLSKDPRPFADFNLGTGIGTSVKEVIAAVERATKLPVKHTYGPRRPGDPPQLTADGTKARMILNWNPQKSDIQSIVESAAKWYEDHFMGESKHGQ